MTSCSLVCPNIINFPDAPRAPRAPDRARHGRSIALPHGAARLCVAAAMAMAIAMAMIGAMAAADVGRADPGARHLTGGVTPQELKAIAARRSEFSFALYARSRLSGGLVADARVHISDGADQVVLDAAMDGPWLLVSMVPGRYRVTVTFQDEILHREVEIPARGQRELVVDFRSAGEASLYPAR